MDPRQTWSQVLKGSVTFEGMSNTSVPPRKEAPGWSSCGKNCPQSSLRALQTAVVGVVRLVVHDEFVVHKVETIRSGLIRVRHHLANWKERRIERWEDRK